MQTKSTKQVVEEQEIFTEPQFVGLLKGTKVVKEHQRAHFEAKIFPVGDSSMVVTWWVLFFE